MVVVLVAPDKFKGSLTALEVGQALSAGILAARPDVHVDVVPVADGGDGTLAAALSAGYSRIPVSVAGPTGQPVHSAFGRRNDRAVIELADACGLSRLPNGVPAPLTAGSAGVGELIGAALDAGCRRLVVGVGGSASTDGGAGMVRALGARLLNDAGQDIGEGGAALIEVDHLDLTGLHPALAEAEILIGCDVDNPLTGPAGAAVVYGPQKGATEDDIRILDRALTRWADVLQASTSHDRRNTPGAGAAGGVAFAATALLGARLVSGIDLMLDLVDFSEHVQAAALVVTGEGSFDTQTLHGKAPAGIAAAAHSAGLPVIMVCGRNLLTPPEWQAAGFTRVFALSSREPDVPRSIRDAAALLEQVGVELAELIPVDA